MDLKSNPLTEIQTECLRGLFNCSSATLRDVNAEILRDYLICLKDGVDLQSWLEDVQDEPDAYPYSADDLTTFLSLI